MIATVLCRREHTTKSVKAVCRDTSCTPARDDLQLGRLQNRVRFPNHRPATNDKMGAQRNHQLMHGCNSLYHTHDDDVLLCCSCVQDDPEGSGPRLGANPVRAVTGSSPQRYSRGSCAHCGRASGAGYQKNATCEMPTGDMAVRASPSKRPGFDSVACSLSLWLAARALPGGRFLLLHVLDPLSSKKSSVPTPPPSSTSTY